MYGDDVRVNDGSWKEAFGYEDESGRATKGETNGVVDRERNGKKRGRGARMWMGVK
jgi:hypothetical protein